MRLSHSLLAFVGLSLIVLPAHASPVTFDFTISGSGYTGSGTLTGVADPSDPTAYDLTSGSGTLNGTAITFNYMPGVDIDNPGYDATAGAKFDNVLYPSGAALLDSYGLDFTYGSYIVVPFYFNGAYQLYDTSQPFYADVSDISFTATPTPEPSGIVLVGTGLAGAAIFLRRRLGRMSAAPLPVIR